MINHKKNKRGMIALVSLIFLSTVLMVTGTTVLFTSIDLTRSTSEFFKGNLSQASAQSCIEEALKKIQDNKSFTGNLNITTSSSTCTGTITNQGADNSIKIISISNTQDSRTYSITKRVNTTVDPIVLIY
jgi:hypothetical protein